MTYTRDGDWSTQRLGIASSLILAVMTMTLLICPSSALGAKTIVKVLGSTAPGTTGGLFSQPRGVAVNVEGKGGAPAGTIYVVDGINRRIQRFAPNGEFVSAWGWDVTTGGVTEFELCNVAASCKAGSAAGNGAGQLNNPQGIAIDQATGNLFVSDQGSRRINVFSAVGEFQGAFGWGALDGNVAAGNEFEFCTMSTGCASPNTTAGSQGGKLGAAIGGLAVDPVGNLYVSDKTNRRVTVFKLFLGGAKKAVVAAEFLRAFGWGVATGSAAFEVCVAASTCKVGLTGTNLGQFAANSPSDMAVDSTGDLYTLDAPNNRAQKFDGTPTPISPPGFESSGAISAAFGGALYGIATDRAAGRLFISGSTSPSSIPPGQVRVAEMDSAGILLDVHGPDLTITSAIGLAAAPQAAGGGLYVSSLNAGQRVFILNNPPVASLDDITTHTATTATFSGSVDPVGGEVTCTFQHSTNQVVWTDVPDPNCASLLSGGGPQVIGESVVGLQPNQTYFVRLNVIKAFGGGSFTTPVKTFTTDAAAPSISGSAVTSISNVFATLTAKVNPNNQATNYHFEYGNQGPCSSNPCSKTSEMSAGAGGTTVSISQSVNGLDPSTTYHFRLVAANGTGTTEGEDATFTTLPDAPGFGSCANDSLRVGPSADLPDCRAYERATPIAKNGGDAEGDKGLIQASTEGDAITFFVGGGIPGGDGAQDFPVYLAKRDGEGWSTEGLYPPTTFGSFNIAIRGWTPDLAYVFSRVALTAPSSPALLSRSSADGLIETVVPYTALGATGTYDFAGVSVDNSKVFFEVSNTTAQLAPEAPMGKPNLYVWDRDTQILSLAGILPESACGLPPCVPPGGSFAGSYDWFEGVDAAALGRGGAAEEYYLQTQHPVATDGSVFFTAGDTGQLYLRENAGEPGASTQHVSASHKTNGSGPGGTDRNGPLPAAFMAATPDGSKAFFTSSEELTNDANTGGQDPRIGRANIDGTIPDLDHIPLVAAEGIAVDATYIYWVDSSSNAIGRAKLDGTEVDEGFITGVDNPQGIAVNATHIYWANSGITNAIGRAKLDGTEVDQTCVEGATEPRGIDLDSTYVYWANAGANPGIGAGNLGRAKLDCSEANQELIIGAVAGDVAVNGTHVYYSRSNGSNGFIRRANLDGTGEENMLSLSPVLEGAKTAPPIALDGSYIYAANPNTGVVARAKLDGTEVMPNFLKEIPSPRALAVNTTHIYWSSNPPKGLNPGNDLYRYDTEADELVNIAPDDSSNNGTEARGVLGISDDGSHVYFAANSVLTTEPNGQGESAAPGNCDATGKSGFCNLYHWHEGDPLTFVSPLDATAASWIPTAKTLAENSSRVSSAGNVLLFRSVRQLTPYDNQSVAQLYRYDAENDEIICVSCNPTGAPPKGGSFPPPGLRSIHPFQKSPPIAGAILTRNLSSSGDQVFFETTEKLLAADTNGDSDCPQVTQAGSGGYFSCLDVYEWEAEGAGSCETPGGCLYLLSTGTSPSPSFFADASASGEDAFIFTRDRLVPQDQDDQVDIYNASVGGGLASQHAVESPGCIGDTCQGPSAPAPSLPSAGSGAFAGPSNPSRKVTRKKCKRGPKGRKCRKARKRKRTAHSTRRVGK